MLKIHQTGNWPEGAVRVLNATSTRRIVPDVEAIIDHAWQVGRSKIGMHLFDGPLCRLESWHATAELLELSVSATSYRIFFGTNLSSERVAERFGNDTMANPIGVSTALLSADNWLMLGRRNGSVAYYPNRVHPFAGSLEPRDSDVFAAVRRELNEELQLSAKDIPAVRCIGIVEDELIRHPELIFHARCGLTRAVIESQLDATEHGGSIAIEATEAALSRALGDISEFTPVGVAATLLFGKDCFGEEWFRKTCSCLASVSLSV